MVWERRGASSEVALQFLLVSTAKKERGKRQRHWYLAVTFASTATINLARPDKIRNFLREGHSSKSLFSELLAWTVTATGGGVLSSEMTRGFAPPPLLGPIIGLPPSRFLAVR